MASQDIKSPPLLGPDISYENWKMEIAIWLACEQGEGEERGRGEGKGACRNGQRFRFPNAGNLCHVQINYLGGNHNNSN